jgi:hypothetical protein
MTQPVPRLTSLFKLEYPQSVGVYGTYDEAQQVVDFLADARFPVENLCIVGTELRSIERVLGRRSWGTVIAQGLQSGISTGLIMALIFVFLGTTNVVGLFLYALAIGILVGIAFAAFGYWMSQGKRDFRSVSQTMATKYEVLAEHKVAGQAKELIATMPGARSAQFGPVQEAPTASPQPGYGVQQPGYPQPGYPQQAYPYPQAYPQQTYPYPPQGYPQQTYPPAFPYPQQQAPLPPEAGAEPSTPASPDSGEPAGPSSDRPQP